MKFRSLRLAALVALIAPAAFADEGWQALTAEGLRQALTGHAVSYDDGAHQSFGGDGGTVYVTDRSSSGNWRVEGDRYCSVWPPSDRWACYRVEVRSGGQRIRFLSDDGSATEGELREK